MITIKVKPTRELFFNEEQSFGIYACEVSPEHMSEVNMNQYSGISIKGITPRLNLKEEYEVMIREDKGSNYKGSYLLEGIKKQKPITVNEQKAFLSTILTETQIENIYSVYSENDNIVELIENNEFDYSKVKGLGDKTYEKLKKKVMDNIDISEALSFLSQYGIKYNTISSLIKKFGNPNIVIAKIEKNPYLLTEASGIGFKKADEIAKAVQFDMTSPLRILSCIEYVLKEESKNGHSWATERQVMNSAIDLLNLDKNYVLEAMEEIKNGNNKRLITVGDKVSTRLIYNSEKLIAERIKVLQSSNKMIFEKEELEEMIDKYCEENGVELEENQRQFFHDWNENNVLALIGSGGMGKSWLLQILLKFIEEKSLSVTLLAPTGKASKVISNYTGRKALTIHRKIGIFDEESTGFAIEEDVIVVDESSMCDVIILSKLMQSIRNSNARILFIGDDFQLPSVGVGNFLYDLINSGEVKISRLKKVFRQTDGGILNVATDIRENKKFLNNYEDGRKVLGKDCVFWLTESEYIRDGLIVNYKKIFKKYKADDIAILTPTNKDKLGTIELNKEIQKIANPPSPNKAEKAFGRKDNPTIYRVGDYVMNVVNIYDADTLDGRNVDVFNGDTGFIKSMNDDKKIAVINFDGFDVIYKYSDILMSINHAWVTTYHKSQGSQYKIVIAIADKSMAYQLNANILYTGLSRAKDYELVFTQPSTVNRAMDKFANMERRSFLQDFLKNTFNLVDLEDMAIDVEEDLDEDLEEFVS